MVERKSEKLGFVTIHVFSFLSNNTLCAAVAALNKKKVTGSLG